MVAGEASGDLLAAQLLAGLKSRLGDTVDYAGIGGKRMMAEGFRSDWPMETLSVNGYVEVLGSLREIRRRAARCATRCSPSRRCASSASMRPISISARKCRCGARRHRSSISSARRSGRRGADPHHRTSGRPYPVPLSFEPEIYARAGIPATYVGHPLADVIPMVPDVAGARARLGLPEGRRVVAVLPGSRRSGGA